MYIPGAGGIIIIIAGPGITADINKRAAHRMDEAATFKLYKPKSKEITRIFCDY
jgi:hypothetical protein